MPHNFSISLKRKYFVYLLPLVEIQTLGERTDKSNIIKLEPIKSVYIESIINKLHLE